jgi:hypothetical protein
MAGTAFDILGSAEPLMKRYYDDGRVYSMAYKRRPLLGMIPKKTGVVGGSPFGNAKGGYQVPLTLDDIAGESARFGSAATARDGNSHIVWDMNRVKRYATYTIDGETVDAMTGVGSFMDASRPLMNSAINQVSNSMAYMAYHDGTGHRGKIGAISTNVLTLDAATSYLARTLSLKRTLVSSSDTSGSAAPDGESTGSKITAIVLDNGSGLAEITVASGTNFGVADYIFALGDYTTSGDDALVCMDGMGSWGPTPSGVTSGDDHKGVDRSVWKEKLLMLHETIALQTAANHGDGKFVRGIREALAVGDANEASLDALFVSPARWSQIESDLAAQARYEMMFPNKQMEEAKVGFKTISFNSAGVQVYSDPFCPPNTGYALQLNTWEMFSIRRIPGPVSRDGNLYRRLEGADEVEARIGGYGNIACNAPGHNMVLNFATS